MQQVRAKTQAEALEVATVTRSSCLGLRVSRLNRLVGRCFESALRPLDLSIAQMEILSALVLVGEPVRPADLSSWLAVERSTMSRNLALMERRGYTEAATTSATGRSQRVTITAAGVTALAQAHDAWSEAQQAVLADLGDETIPILDGWLASMGSPTG